MAETIKNENVFVVDPSTGAQKFIDLRGLDHFWTKAQAYVDAEDIALGKRIDDVVSDLDDLTAIVNSMNGTSGSGTIADRIQAAITALKLDETYETKTDASSKLAEAKGYTDSEVSAMAATLRGEMADDLAEAKTYADGEISKAVGVYSSEGVEATGLRKEIEERDAQVITTGNRYADDLNSAMDARVKVLEAIDHDQLAADAAASAVATVVGEAPAAFDTLKEIVDWIGANESNAEGFDVASRIVALESDKADKTYVDEQDGKLEVRVKALEDVKDAYVEADATLASTLRSEIATAKGEAKGYTDEKVGALTGTVDTLAGTVASNLTEAKSYADGVAATAKAEAIADADLKLANYSTTAQMEQAIADAKAEAIADAQGKIDSLTTVVNGKADKTYVDQQDAAVKVYAATYTDQLFASITFASNTDIESIF